ncbi:MAG: tetratricopeptide repeat protein [Verrucomicrobia bacterium]|nr:tetratricopeptide repeat protein [Verrucomicrobiota bacterium]
MAFSELIAGAEVAIKNQQPAVAAPLLKEIIARAELVDDEQARESVQMARLRLGMALADLQKTEEARRYIEEYLKGTPCEKADVATQVLCRLSVAEGDWQTLYETASRIIDDKQIALRHKSSARAYLVQALFELGKYDQALEMLPEVMAEADDEQTVQLLKIMQLRALLETGKVAGGIELLSALFRGDTRYDTMLNLTLLRMGDKMFDSQRYNQARILYGKITPRPELIAWLAQEVELLKQKNAGRKEWRKEDSARKETFENNILLLNDIPDYSVYVTYRVAQIFAEQTRYWEASALFDRLYKQTPASDEGKGAFLQRVMLLFELDQDEEAIAVAEEYIQSNTSGLYPRLVCIQLMQHYLAVKQYDDALALVATMDRWTRPANDAELDQETTLRYMVGFTHFQAGDYDEAYAAFDRVARLNPNSQAGMDTGYWKAMCRLLQMKYKEAYEAFVSYRQTWPRATFAPAALFRAGVCRFGLEDYAGAKKAFQEFVDSYSRDTLMPEVLSMLADLQAADGQIDEALAGYRRAIELVKVNYERQRDPVLKKQIVVPATYAVVQAAQTLEADAEAYREEKEYQVATEKLQEIITLVEDYLDAFGQDSDFAPGVFWTGRAQIQLGQVEEAVSSYLDAVLRFGKEPAAEGVADILFDLAGIIERKLTPEQREQTIEKIRAARERAATRALQIRLDVLLAELDDTTDELGRTLLAGEKDLSVVPPAGLSLMCAALLETGDVSRSQEFYDHFTANHEGSVFMKNAYRLRSEELYQQGDLDQALKLAEETLAQYGGSPGTGWAQVMKGRVQTDQKKYEEAVKTFKAVFSVGAWRKEAVAEATYRLADAYVLQGDYRKAFAFFQRTYLIYKASNDGLWAAESYLRSAECLRKLGQEPAARNTYRAMLLDDYVKEHPRAVVAREALGSQEVAELMSAGTNAMESVEAEVDL